MGDDVAHSDLLAIAERQKVRYRLLRALYRISDSNTLCSVNLAALADQEGIDRVQARVAHQYLVQERLIKFAGAGPSLPVFITHAGVVEVEHSIQHPDRATPHFMVQVIQHFHGTVGAVQTGASSSATVKQGGDPRGNSDGNE
jgi:hypothetical protein